MTALFPTSRVENPSSLEQEKFTIWGLEPRALHDHYWASRGIQVVRAGARAGVDRRAELFLLIDPQRLVLFDLEEWIELLNWTKPDILLLRLQAKRDLGYREVFVANPEGDFLGFQRRYRSEQTLVTRVGLSCDIELAEAWDNAQSMAKGWRQLRRAIPGPYRETRSARARIYRPGIDREARQFIEELATIWSHPGATISRARPQTAQLWADQDAKIDEKARVIGHVWIGAGRQIAEKDVIIGPAVLYDEPQMRPEPEKIRWSDIEPISRALGFHPRPKGSTWRRVAKRGFDILFALVAILFTLPVYPLVMLAILLEDGWPFFYAHERETMGGGLFSCWKFRSMRKDAHRLQAQLAARNQADGPQFFMDDDPRLTRVGRFIRKTNIDEIPQFFNVLVGQMSVVGPRPSPRYENQYCAEWREARLSVRPGITGLWQVRRTRLRGRDFQEWIQYDIHYVDNVSSRLDLKIIVQTILVVIRRAVRE